MFYHHFHTDREDRKSYSLILVFQVDAFYFNDLSRCKDSLIMSTKSSEGEFGFVISLVYLRHDYFPSVPLNQ